METPIYPTNVSELKTEVFFIPIIGEFNIAPYYYGSVSSMSDIDDAEVFREYTRRFEDAWRELAEK